MKDGWGAGNTHIYNDSSLRVLGKRKLSSHFKETETGNGRCCITGCGLIGKAGWTRPSMDPYSKARRWTHIKEQRMDGHLYVLS